MNRDILLGNLVTALSMLENCREFSLLIPEVRVNLAYALPDARTRQEVAAIEGRITNIHGWPHASGMPTFGASDHMARLIIESRKYDPLVNAGINFKCDEIIIKIVKQYCSQQNLSFGWINRRQEPVEITTRDGTSMPWKIGELVHSSGGQLPHMFYEGEGWGKEPLFVAVGSTAVEVVTIAIDIAHDYQKIIKTI